MCGDLNTNVLLTAVAAMSCPLVASHARRALDVRRQW
jgi:hypothetical protein